MLNALAPLWKAAQQRAKKKLRCAQATQALHTPRALHALCTRVHSPATARLGVLLSLVSASPAR